MNQSLYISTDLEMSAFQRSGRSLFMDMLPRCFCRRRIVDANNYTNDCIILNRYCSVYHVHPISLKDKLSWTAGTHGYIVNWGRDEARR